MIYSKREACLVKVAGINASEFTFQVLVLKQAQNELRYQKEVISVTK